MISDDCVAQRIVSVASCDAPSGMHVAEQDEQYVTFEH